MMTSIGPRRSPAFWLAMFLVVLFLASCSTMEEKRDKFFAEGKEYYEKGDYIKARLQFKNALQIDPKFAEATLWIGKVELKLGNFRGAYGALSQAVQLKPELIEGQIILGQLLLLAKQLDQAEEKAKLVLDREPQNPEALMLSGALAQGRDQPDKALEIFAKVSSLKPDLIGAYLGTAAIQAKEKRPEAAAAALEKGIKANPKSIELLLARASLAESQKHPEEAESFLLKAVELEPKNTKLHIGLARHYIKAGQQDKAEKALKQNLLLEPDKESHAVALAQFQSIQGRRTEAEQTLTDFVAKNKDNLEARFALADFYISRGQPGRGQKVLREIAGQDPTGPKGMEAKNRLARMELGRGHVDEAEKMVAEILKDNPKDMTATQTAGLIALAQKDGLKAVNDFRVIAQDKPQDPENWLLLARAHLLNKEPEQAKDKAKKALELKPDYLEARKFLYSMFLEAKDYDGAIQTIQGYLRLNDKDANNLLALGETYARAGNNAKSREFFQKVVDLEPKNPQGYFHLALLNLKMKKTEEASKYLDKALAADSNFVPAVQILVGLYQEQKLPAKALAAAQQAVSHNPKNPQLQQILGEILLVQKQPKAAAAALEEAINLNPRQLAALRLLTVAYLQEADPDQVLSQLEQRTADPKSSPIYFLVLASLYERQQKYDKAIALYESMITRDLFSSLARNNLAYLLAEHQGTPENLARAWKLSSETLEDNPEEGSFLDTSGWIQCKQGNFAKAKLLLEKALTESPNQPSLLYHLGYCQLKLGETQAAQENFQKALDSKADFPYRQETEKLLKSVSGEGKP